MTKRGNPSTLSPKVKAELHRLRTQTATPVPEIIAAIGQRFGLKLTPDSIGGHADRRGWRRDAMLKSSNHRSVVADRVFTQRWTRWADGGRPADNPVRLVEPGTFPASGFRIGARQ